MFFVGRRECIHHGDKRDAGGERVQIVAPPATREIEMIAPPSVESVREGVDVEVQVRGRAGTSAVAWLAAREAAGALLGVLDAFEEAEF